MGITKPVFNKNYLYLQYRENNNYDINTHELFLEIDARLHGFFPYNCYTNNIYIHILFNYR
jgi:hypothetical protein